RLSMNGPGIATADVNNDGLYDVYISSPENSRPRLLLQTISGSFIESRQVAFDTICEQQGAIFLDIDNDNDMDLYVANGGNESITDEPERMQDRLYINDGKGNYSLGTLPVMLTSTSCVVAGDIDNDGDMDLFVGGRNNAGNYPSMPRSYILINNNGVFIDVTENIASVFIANPSMVQSALWTDFDNDNWLDLIVVGEWSPIRFFKNNGGQLTEITEITGINGLHGWWNSINGGDFDNDGDIDYVVGNFGPNIRYRGSEKYPIEFFANDFDKNGSADHLMTYWENDKRYAVRSLMAFYNQMPILRKRFPLYRDYVQLSFDDVFSKESLDSSQKMLLNCVHSLYVENLGNGKFRAKNLPALAQIAPILGSAIQDFDEDGNLDIVISGNFYGPDVEAWRYDAGYGLLLRGDGKGGFIPQDALHSGICIHGDSRGIIALPSHSNARITLCAPVNGGYVQTFVTRPLTSEIITITPTQRYAMVELKNGKQRKHEFYCGSGYLSQSANFLIKSKQVKKIILK
ncbi:MAG TPA: VCBS repeat-containing protein, partial [Candidatus Kapabacteria bacterium]|nr:VCBS repeat-containing protein [Candidatus Kapabacteria bacterium]